MESHLWLSTWCSDSLSRVHLSGVFCLREMNFYYTCAKFIHETSFSLLLFSFMSWDCWWVSPVLSSHVILLFVWNTLSWTSKFAKSSCRIWALACMGHRGGAHWVLVGRHEGMRPLGWPRGRLEDNSKMALQEVGWGGMYWIDLA